jgi:hypothetical protein
VKLLERIRTWVRRHEDAARETDSERIDAMTAGRGFPIAGGEGGAIPPNYLPTRGDEGRPRK